MEALAELCSTGTDALRLQRNAVLSPFYEPTFNDDFTSTGFTRLYSKDATSNSTGSYYFHYDAELLPKVHDLSKLYCKVESSLVKIINGKEVAVLPRDKVMITNNYLDALWKNISVTINNSEAYESCPDRYHYVQIAKLINDELPDNSRGLSYLAMANHDEEAGSHTVNMSGVDRSNAFLAEDVEPEQVLFHVPEEADADQERRDARNARNREGLVEQDTDLQPTLTPAEKAAAKKAADAAKEKAEQEKKRRLEADKDYDNRSHLPIPRVWTIGTLTYGLMTAKKNLPWDCSITIRLDKQSDEYLIHCQGTKTAAEAEQYHIKIHSVKLFYRFFYIKDGLYSMFKNMYSQGKTSKLFFLKPYTHSSLIEVGTRCFSRDIGFPKRSLVKLFVVFLNPQRYHGDREYASNVYRQPPKLRRVRITQANTNAVNLEPFSDETRDDALLQKLYFDLLLNVQVLGMENSSNSLTFAQFKKSAFIVSINCVGNGMLQSDSLPLVRQGPIHLNVELREPLETPQYVFYLGYTICKMAVSPRAPVLLSDELSYERN